MNKYLYSVLLLIAVLLQITVVDLISVSSIKPNLPLLIVLYLTPRETVMVSLGLAFATGVVADLAAGSLLGLTSLSLTAAVMAVAILTRDWVEANYSRMASVFAIGAGVYELVFHQIYLLGSELGPVGVLFRYVLPTTAYDVAFGMLVLAALPVSWWRRL